MLWLFLLLSARPTATLDYLAPSECPTEEGLIDRVATRLGYDPFTGSGPIRIAGRVTGGRSLKATLAIADPAASTPGEWEKSAPNGRCAELIEEMALAISLALDPLGIYKNEAPPPPPPPLAPPAPPPPPPPARTASVAPARVEPGHPLLLVEVGPYFGLVPGVAGGIGAGGGYRIGAFSIQGRGRFAQGGTLLVAGRSGVSTAAVYFAAQPCWVLGLDVGRLSACGSVAAGALFITGQDLSPSRSATKPLVLGGLRLAYALPLTTSLGLEVSAELDAALTRNIVLIGGVEVWQQPPISSFISLGLWFEP